VRATAVTAPRFATIMRSRGGSCRVAAQENGLARPVRPMQSSPTIKNAGAAGLKHLETIT
jgi:hypothetical protein